MDEVLLLAEAVLALARAVREQPAPVINVTVVPSAVTVEQPEQAPPTVTVNVPPIVLPPLAAPLITVQAAKAPPPMVIIHEPPERAPRKLRITRNRAGEMTGIEEV